MYNGIGLQTTRGTGTNGHVQTNKAHIKYSRNHVTYQKPSHPDDTTDFFHKKPNADILKHSRKREVELKCLEMQDLMEEQGYNEDEIESKVSKFREVLVQKFESESENQDNNPLNVKAFNDTHLSAEASKYKNEVLRKAFQITPDYKEGMGFESREKRLERAKAAKAKYELVKSDDEEKSSAHSQSPSEDESAKDDYESQLEKRVTQQSRTRKRESPLRLDCIDDHSEAIMRRHIVKKFEENHENVKMEVIDSRHEMEKAHSSKKDMVYGSKMRKHSRSCEKRDGQHAAEKYGREEKYSNTRSDRGEVLRKEVSPGSDSNDRDYQMKKSENEYHDRRDERSSKKRRDYEDEEASKRQKRRSRSDSSEHHVKKYEGQRHDRRDERSSKKRRDYGDEKASKSQKRRSRSDSSDHHVKKYEGQRHDRRDESSLKKRRDFEDEEASKSQKRRSRSDSSEHHVKKYDGQRHDRRDEYSPKKRRDYEDETSSKNQKRRSRSDSSDHHVTNYDSQRHDRRDESSLKKTRDHGNERASKSQKRRSRSKSLSNDELSLKDYNDCAAFKDEERRSRSSSPSNISPLKSRPTSKRLKSTISIVKK